MGCLRELIVIDKKASYSVTSRISGNWKEILVMGHIPELINNAGSLSSSLPLSLFSPQLILKSLTGNMATYSWYQKNWFQ